MKEYSVTVSGYVSYYVLAENVEEAREQTRKELPLGFSIQELDVSETGREVVGDEP